VYDGETGSVVEEFVAPASGLNGAAFLTFGPDGDLFIATVTNTGKRDSILRVDQVTKAVTTFVSNNPGENGGLDNVKGMLLSPDGSSFYAASGNTDCTFRDLIENHLERSCIGIKQRRTWLGVLAA
jgi:hypothetical protein